MRQARSEAEAIEDAIRAVLKAGHRTRDIESEAEGQLATTSEIGKLCGKLSRERRSTV